jgi:drug/metabolite transporter (DMT)-like permease
MSSAETHRRVEAGTAWPFAALCLGAVSMGASPIFVRFAATDLGPFAIAFWRVALALPVLYAWMRLEEATVRAAPRRSFGRATVLAGAAFAGDLFFWHLSILNTTVANATFFATTAPIFVVLMVWLVLRQHVARATVIGLVLCLLGGAALIGQSLQVDPARIRGDLYGVATAVFFGLTIVAVGHAREGGGAARVTYELTVVTTALLLGVSLLLEDTLLPRTPGAIAALVALAWISHAGGQGLLAVALGRLPAVFSSLVIFLEAIAAAGFGWLILGERLGLLQVFGGSLILIGIYVARPRSVRA